MDLSDSQSKLRRKSKHSNYTDEDSEEDSGRKRSRREEEKSTKKATKTRERNKHSVDEIDYEIENLAKQGIKLNDSEVDRLKSMSMLERNMEIERLQSERGSRRIFSQIKSSVQKGQPKSSKFKKDESSDDDDDSLDSDEKSASASEEEEEEDVDNDDDDVEIELPKKGSRSQRSSSQSKQEEQEPSTAYDITLADANRMLLRRENIRNALSNSIPKERLKGLWVRVFTGTKEDVRYYAFCHISDIKEFEIHYEVDGIKTSWRIEAEVATTRKWFNLDIVSNQDVTPDEFSKWKDKMKRENIPLPTLQEIEASVKAVSNLANAGSSKETTQQEEAKKKKETVLFLRIVELRDECMDAEQRGDFEKSATLQEQLDTLEKKYQEYQEKYIQGSTSRKITYINKRGENQWASTFQKKHEADGALRDLSKALKKDLNYTPLSVNLEMHKPSIRGFLSEHCFKIDLDLSKVDKSLHYERVLQKKQT